MKKNTVIGLLAILLTLSLFYGIHQKIRADKYEQESVTMKAQLQDAVKIAEINAEEARKQRLIDDEQKQIAVKAKDNQKGVKK